MAFATYVEMEAWAGRTLANHDRIDELLSIASDMVTDHCGWHIAPSVTETIRVGTPGGRVLELPSLHVTDVTSISWNDRRFDSPIVVDADSYEWAANGLIRLDEGFSWPDTLDAFTVALTHGYTEVPSAVLDVVFRMVVDVINAPIDLPSNVSQYSTGSVSMSFRKDDDAGDMRITATREQKLARYSL